MKRKHLLSLPKYTLSMEEAESVYATGSYYVVLAEIKEEILILTIFNNKKNRGHAEYIIFIQKDGYISLQLVDGKYKWRTSTLYNLLEYGCYYANYGCYANERTIKCHLATYEDYIKEFLGTKPEVDAIRAITDFQNKILRKRLDAKHRKVTDKIDKQMELVPELPKDFAKWVQGVPFGKSKYIYYKRISSTKVNGFCTSCRSEMNAKEAKHNKSGICPVCHKRIIYKAEGKAKRLEDKVNIAIMQSTSEGIVIRCFRGWMDFSYEKYKNAKARYTEYKRTLITGILDGEKEKMQSYEWSDYCNREIRWCEDKGLYTFSNAYIYTKNLDSLIIGTKWKYSQLTKLAKHVGFDLEKFLTMYLENPRLEYLIKGKLYRLVRDIIQDRYSNSVKLNKKKIVEALGVGKEVLPQLQRLDVTKNQLSLMRKAYEKGITLIDRQIVWADENLNYAADILKAVEYTTIHKAIRYVDGQPGTTDNIFNDWLDYLGMCRKLKYDLDNSFILFPKHLKAAHDEVNNLLDVKKNQVHEKAIAAIGNKLKGTYEYASKKYMVQVPTSVMEIVNESNTLRHCVKQYIERVAKKQTVILFIRKMDAPDTPFYTFEVRENRVAQCRGYKNADMTEDVRKFLEQWKANKLRAKSKKKSA